MDMTDEKDNIFASYDQEAFGNVLSGSASGYHLTTKEFSPAIGLYYFFQRWYDSVIGRFISMDNIKSIQTNLYNYCISNPINCFDPEGRIAIIGPIIGGGVIGGAAILGANCYLKISDTAYWEKACNKAQEDMKRMCDLRGWDSYICWLYYDNARYICAKAGIVIAPAVGSLIPGSSLGGPPPSNASGLARKFCTESCKEVINALK